VSQHERRKQDMRIYYHRAHERGTTLAEVLIATVILAISTAGVMAAIFTGFFTVGRTRENQRATQIILEKVETLRLYSWTQVTSNGFIPTTFSQSFDPQASQGAQGIVYHGTLAISPFPFSGASYRDKMRQVTVTLSWTSERNLARTRSFVTYIAKDGVQNYVY